MNTSVLPWSENPLPETDEDDDGRSIYLTFIKGYQEQVVGKAIQVLDSTSEEASLEYLRHRVNVMSHLTHIYFTTHISQDKYVQLCEKPNIDIIAWWSKKWLFPKNYDK